MQFRRVLARVPVVVDAAVLAGGLLVAGNYSGPWVVYGLFTAVAGFSLSGSV